MRALKTIPEAAELLRISHWTVRKDIRDGKLTPVRLGRRVLLEEAELERFVAESKKSKKSNAKDISPQDTSENPQASPAEGPDTSRENHAD